MSTNEETITELGRGAYWQDLHVGQRFRTLRRTITETDLINFISTTGMLEAIFIDAEFEGAAIDGRPVPAALTQCMIEGLLFQTMIQGTGLALLEMTLKALKPVRIGDTVWATVTVTGIKPTSKHNRAVIDSEIAVFNTRDEQVLSYTAKRMLAGRT
ncbi:MaoC family dehydratase [Solimonas terrae]|uniref:MaoC family dehydratase n=1 Tax=Solimonas terrae TaxID=1396819 RepID=A0A6M2BTB3_9GAMM|nr:MaoC family dehydratase [Solimonas terrae]NGY05207.1 MaoC family dehydratase [Solimonas terrae]